MDAMYWLATLGTLSLMDRAIYEYAIGIPNSLTPTRWLCETSHSHHARETCLAQFYEKL
jgi:hypothetical protein